MTRHIPPERRVSRYFATVLSENSKAHGCYHMPHMNGDVAAAHMKRRKADVPVALMSADNLPVLANLKAVDAFVCKSEAIGKVLEIVDELLSRRVLFQPLESWKAGHRAA